MCILLPQQRRSAPLIAPPVAQLDYSLNNPRKSENHAPMRQLMSCPWSPAAHVTTTLGLNHMPPTRKRNEIGTYS